MFFISVYTFGQSSNTLTPGADVEVISVDSISWTDLKNGFVRNDSICHCGYRLDSNFTFKLYSSDCVSSFVIDTGDWEIKNNNTLVLKSKEEVKAFQVIKVADSRFFIPPNKLQIFKKDLKAVLVKSKYETTSKYFSRNLAFRLGGKYFCR